MGLARLFSPRACAPVVLQAFHSKSPEVHDSFGSDFQRLGGVPGALGNARAWRNCPSRSRVEIAGTSQVTFNAWLLDSSRDIQAVRNLAGASRDARSHLKAWRTSYLAAADVDRAFETARYEALSGIARGEVPEDVPRLRRFDMAAYGVQATSVAGIGQLIAELDAALGDAVNHPLAPRLNLVREDLSRLRDEMTAFTTKSLNNKLTQIAYDRRDLFLLNEMAREAEKERARGGADVPLRLAFRGDRCVLKPAKSRAWLASGTHRAKREAGNLAMLIGLPTGAAVTLNTLRARGFGCHENTVVLNDAKSAYAAAGDHTSWFFNRIREMERSRQQANEVLSQMRSTAMSALPPAYTVPKGIVEGVVDDDLQRVPPMSARASEWHAGLAKVGRASAAPDDASYRRSPSVDDAASERRGAGHRSERRTEARGRKPVASPQPVFGPDRATRLHRRAPVDVIPELREEGDDASSTSSLSLRSGVTSVYSASPGSRPASSTRFGFDTVDAGAPQSHDGAYGGRLDRFNEQVEQVMAWHRAGAHPRTSPRPSVALPVVLSRRGSTPPPLPKSPPPDSPNSLNPPGKPNEPSDV